MILRKLMKEGLVYVQHIKNAKNLLNMDLVSRIKLQNNQSLLQRVNFTFSRSKPQMKKKNISVNESNKPNEGIDLSTLPKKQQFTTLKQGIYELIDNKQDDAYFMDILQTFSNFLTSHNRIKDGIVEFEQIVKKMKTAPAFRSSPNYHYVLCEYRYFLVRGGRFEQAITVCQECSRLLKKGSQKQSLHVANELGTFGVVQFMNSDYEESRRLLEKQDKINQKLSDQTFTEYIDCKNNLAILDFVQGNYESALKTFEKNQQLTKRILKSTKKGKEKLYAKHLVYLQAIYQMKMAQLQSEQDKNLLKQKVNEFNLEIVDIMGDNNNLVNDLYLYYETISLHFLKNNLNELCVKFIQKAINLNQKKIQKPSLGGKRDRSILQVTNTISKHYKLLGDAFINLKQFQKANDCYLRAFNRYKKNIQSQQAKQLLTLQNFTNFIQTCRSLFELQFIQQNKTKKTFEEALKYMEEPLLVWNDAVKNIWNVPQWLSFIPYQLNIQIGIKLLENNYIDPAVNYFQTCTKQISNNKNLLCQKSIKNIGQLAEKITALIEKEQIKNSESYISLKTISEQLSSFSKV